MSEKEENIVEEINCKILMTRGGDNDGDPEMSTPCSYLEIGGGWDYLSVGFQDFTTGETPLSVYFDMDGGGGIANTITILSHNYETEADQLSVEFENHIIQLPIALAKKIREAIKDADVGL